MARTKTRIAQVGIGGRAGMFLDAVMGPYKDRTRLVGVCDINRTRMEAVMERYRKRNKYPKVPMYGADAFEKMLAERKVQRVVVTTMDRTHDDYICRAMEAGCDVITEKPMTIDAPRCQRILDTVERTGRDLTVTFNYRYSPRNSKVKEILQSGEIGDVLSVHFEWLLDTKHGADYFRRWHRDKANSGGLLVHKSTHHFDLVNWWLDSTPETVFAMGRLAFYGRENAEKRGMTRFYSRATGHPVAQDDPFALHLDRDERLKAMYLDAEVEDGYQRDQSVFGYNISTEDTLGVLVRYRNQAILTYSLNAHCPWEGFRVMFNGTKGRLELNVAENSYVSTSKDDINLAENLEKEKEVKLQVPVILVQKHWQKPREVTYESAKGGHGGGDVRLLRDVFEGAGDDPLRRAAGHLDGAWSILTGVAGNLAIATGLPVRTRDLVRLP